MRELTTHEILAIIRAVKRDDTITRYELWSSASEYDSDIFVARDPRITDFEVR